ncbi:MAG: beta-glucosidase, partial [Bacteroidia bacterium]
GEVLYPFGFGLSYTSFQYDNLILEKDEIGAEETITVSVDVSNSGAMDGEEVVQLYLRRPNSKYRRPLKDLRGFERIPVKAGQSLVVTMELGPEELSCYDTELGDYVVEAGEYQIMAGPSSGEEGLLITSLVVR